VPRAIWTGSISFGLVNVPVRAYSAVAEHGLHFHLVHRTDDSRIGYEKICRKEDKQVPDDEIVKAFEYAKGKFAYMADEDFEAAKVEGFRTIDIHDFVPYEQIDPIYFRHTYYVGPQEGAEKVYSLLVRAMDESGLAGITKFIMRDRQNLGCLRVRDGVLLLEQMYFADEIRPLADLRPKKARVERDELELALQLIDSFKGDFDAAKYKDTYRDALANVIEAKRKGKKVHAAAETAEEGAAARPDGGAAGIARREAARGLAQTWPLDRRPGREDEGRVAAACEAREHRGALADGQVRARAGAPRRRLTDYRRASVTAATWRERLPSQPAPAPRRRCGVVRVARSRLPEGLEIVDELRLGRLLPRPGIAGSVFDKPVDPVARGLPTLPELLLEPLTIRRMIRHTAERFYRSQSPDTTVRGSRPLR